MKKLQLLIFVQTVVGAVLLGGCASSASQGSFPRSAARTSFDVYYGEVVSTRVVEIEGEASVLGRIGGAAIGFAIGAGNSPWYGNPRRIETAVGAVGGSVAGEAIERRIKTEDGFEIVVLLDHSETIAVVQAGDVAFSPGQRVQVLMGRDGSTRVQPQ
jgi:outer membrane lipoprotein SlyB